MSSRLSSELGVVTIARNEGERFRRCLESIVGRAACIVYADSASTDGSVALARSMGVDVVEMDMSVRFTVSRARNEGFRRLLELKPDVRWVMFVDGDCEVVEGWFEKSLELITGDDSLAAVFGTRRERYPEASAYNRLSDLDWAGPAGESLYCFGDMMARVEAIAKVGGYNEALMVNEDPEIGIRLRAAGYRLLRVDVPMTIHDAAIHRFGQWWKRTVRTGHGYAEGAYLYRNSKEQHWRRQVRSNWMWGILVPAVALLAAWPTWGLSLLLLLLYPVQAWRIARYRQRVMNDAPAHGWLYARFTVLGKFAMAYGQLLFWCNRIRGRHTPIIHYKSPEPVAVSASKSPTE